MTNTVWCCCGVSAILTPLYSVMTYLYKPVGFYGPIVHPRSKCPQFGMPAERRAQFRVPNMPRSRISELAPFRIYEHAKCGVFERTCLQRAYVIPCRQQMGSSTVLQARRSALVLAASTRCLQSAYSIGRECRVHTCVMAIEADSKCISSVSFVRIESGFLQYTGDTDAKNDGPEFF